MKKKTVAGMLGLFLIIRLVPAVSIFWAEHISRPLLAGLSVLGSSFPFVLLEWIPAGILVLGLLRRRFRKTLSGMMLALLLGWLGIWYPLYFLPQAEYSVGNGQLALLCESLIDELNADTFSVPEDLPAKVIRFPGWMEVLDISGLCSFLTGEALISPDLAPVSRPFVAVHEYMHLDGIAPEGTANITAWQECISRGDSYAFSARIWALRYGMGVLRRNAPWHYEKAMLHMNHETRQYYRQAGGTYTAAPVPQLLRRLYGFLGIERQVQDYEILAPYLAANGTQ